MSRIPFRKCCACGEMKEKTELLRIVKTPEGEIFFDQSGKRDGRGAYICKNEACIRKAEKKRAAARSLRSMCPETIFSELLKESSGL